MTAPSIRRALLIRGGLGVGGLLCLVYAAIYLLFRHSLYQELDKSITQTAALLANQIEYESDEVTFEWSEGIGTNRALPADGLFQFWAEKTGTTTRSPGLGGGDLPRFAGPGTQPVMKNITLPNGNRGRAIGLRVYPFVLPDQMAHMKQRGTFIDPHLMPHILVVARNAEPLRQTLELAQQVLASGALLTFALGFVMIDRAIRSALRPINELATQINERTGKNRLDAPLDLASTIPLELVTLANNFDSLLARVATTRQREKDFIRHAAHELRTPIAALQATTELALSQPRDAPAYAAHLAACGKTAAELSELVRHLTALARINHDDLTTKLEPLDLHQLMADCLDVYLPVFQLRNLTVRHLPAAVPAWVTSDPTLIRIIFNNLLDNAASYAPEGGEVLIEWRQTAGQVEVAVANPAAALPDNLDRLFEPLFRRDHATASDASHLGIGLTLSLEAAMALGATLRASRPRDGWIELRFALAASPAPPAHR